MGGQAVGVDAYQSAHRPIRPSAHSSTWYLLVEPIGRPGAEQMARDTQLLAEADCTGRAFLRLYRFTPPCLSLGRNEAAGGYDHAATARWGVDVVRRPTGGGSVWHEHELTYAVAAPIATFGGLRQAYHAIHERIAEALRCLGVDATLALHRPPPPSPALPRPGLCFAHSVGGEILVGGRKLVGSAQMRRGGAFLQHGSILLDGSQEMLAAASRQPQAASRATTLAALLGRLVSFDEVAQAIVATWREEVTFTALHRPPPSSTARFLDPAWTWRR